MNVLSRFPFRQGAKCDLIYVELQAVGSSKRVCKSHLTVDNEGTVTTNDISNNVPWSTEGLLLLVELTPCLFTPHQSLTFCPPRPLCQSLQADIWWKANSRCACACFAFLSGCSLTTGAFTLGIGCFAHGCGCNHVPVLGHHVPAYLSDVMRLID